MQFNLSTTTTVGTEEVTVGERWSFWGGRVLCHLCFLGGRGGGKGKIEHDNCAKFMLTVAYNGNPIKITNIIDIP